MSRIDARHPRIIFLDVDGVLNHPAHWTFVTMHRLHGLGAQCDPRCVGRVCDLVQDTDAGIVVSSTHRRRSVTATREVFAEYGIPARYIVGITPTLEQRDPKTGLYTNVTRGQEIRAWLDAHPVQNRRFAILDDDRDMGDLLPYLVRIDPSVGLTDADCADAAELLRDPLR